MKSYFCLFYLLLLEVCALAQVKGPEALSPLALCWRPGLMVMLQGVCPNVIQTTY